MKQKGKLSRLLACGILLSACSSSNDNTAVKDLEKRVAKLEQLLANEADNSSDKTANASAAKTAKNTESSQAEPTESNTVANAAVYTLEINEVTVISGEVVIGKDLAAGTYDIEPPTDLDISFKLYRSQTAQSDQEYDFYWLFPKNTLSDSDILKAFSLKNGYIVDSGSDNVQLTRIR